MSRRFRRARGRDRLPHNRAVRFAHRSGFERRHEQRQRRYEIFAGLDVATIELQLLRPMRRQPRGGRKKEGKPACCPGNAGVFQRVAMMAQVGAFWEPGKQAPRRSQHAPVIRIRAHETHRLVQPFHSARRAQPTVCQFIQRDQLTRRKRRAEAVLQTFETDQTAGTMWFLGSGRQIVLATRIRVMGNRLPGRKVRAEFGFGGSDSCKKKQPWSPARAAGSAVPSPWLSSSTITGWCSRVAAPTRWRRR